MADTIRILAELQALLPDNITGQVSPQDLRDFLVSAMPTGRTATKVVASSTASALQRAQADYVCNGTADDVQIQLAIDALPAGGGSVVLSEGTFTLAAQLVRTIDNVTIIGSGRGTRLNLNGSTAVISVGSQAGWSLLGFDTDAGGIDVASASEFLLDYWEDGARQTNQLAHGDLSDAPTTAHHNNASDPTSGQKAALPGTSGTPGSGNKYVTDEDSRVTQAVTILDRNLTPIDVVSTVAEASIYSFEIPAGALGATGGFRLRLSGNLLSNAAGALTIRATFGGTEVILSNARGFTQSGIRHRWMLDILCINSAADAQLWDSNFTAILGVAGITLPLVLTETSSAILGIGDSGSAEDTTGALTFEVTVQWSLNSANLSFRKKIALLELLPAA